MTTLTKEVTLNPGQSQAVSFQVIPQVAGVYSVGVDGLTGEFQAVPAGYGKKAIEATNLSWLDEQPFIGGEKYRYEVTLRSLWSEPVSFMAGLWYEPWWSEGGWNRCNLEGFEEKTFQHWARVPAEQGGYMAMLHLYAFLKAFYLQSIPMETIQNPDALIPPQAPPTYPDWTGLKDFPAPYSRYQAIPPYDRIVEAIRLPMLSRSHSTEGELVIRLLSPQDWREWTADVGCMGPDKRYGRCGRGFSPTYSYWIAFDYASPIYTTLTEDEPSDLFTLPITFPKTSKPIGKYPITVMMMTGDESSTNFAIFWSPDIGRYHRYALIGYINVGA